MSDRVRWTITIVLIVALVVALFLTPAGPNPFRVEFPW
jgi:hypothetical protein